MNEKFFDYLVATDQVDDFLGYKGNDIDDALSHDLCLCMDDILKNNLTNVNDITYIDKTIEISKIADNRYEITGYADLATDEGKIKQQFIVLFVVISKKGK